MRIVELDAGRFKTPLEFLDAVRRAIGAPQGSGLDIDALVGAMLRGGSANTPATIRIAGVADAPAEIRGQIEALAKALGDARLWRHNHRYDEIVTAIEIAS